MKMIKVLVFDFDGVIVNEFKLHYELTKQQIKDLTETEFKKLFEGNIHAEKEKLKNRDTGFDMKTYFDESKKRARIKPEIKKSLKAFSTNFILGVISSAKENGIIECLKNNQLEDVFSFVYGFETGKLKSEKFNLMLNKYGISKDEVIFVTDTLGDILEATKIGIKTVAVEGGYHDKKTLAKGNPLKIISGLSQLEDVVKTI